MRTKSCGLVIVATTTAVITFVRLAIGRGSSGLRRHRTSPLARSNTIPARGGRSLKWTSKASSPSSATDAGEDGGAGGSCRLTAGGDAVLPESPPSAHPLRASATRSGASRWLVIRGRRQRPQHAEAEQREHDEREHDQHVHAVLDGHAQRQEGERPYQGDREDQSGVACRQ